MNIYNTSHLFKTFSRPSSKEEINDWLNLDNAINFLEADINDSHIILYASSKYLFLHSILIHILHGLLNVHLHHMSYMNLALLSEINH